ncbi:MAG: carbamate kinase [Myxococcota bacterium]
MANRVVVALGGNAFSRRSSGLTMEGQFRFAHEALAQLAPLLGPSHQLVLSHGNGPQVGHMLVRVERTLGEAYAVPLEVCVAETEGELGYVLLQSLHNVIADLGVRRPIASLLTQVVVSPEDDAFLNPTKPIGPFYDARRAAALRVKGFELREEAGRGFRRVVPSPEPLEIVDLDVLEQLLERGVLVIAAGGGGIPVVREGGRLSGIDAVVDKDLTAALLADRVGADRLVILTGVPCAYLHYGREDQQPLGLLSPERVTELLAEGHFPPGSMGPKMEAARRFATRCGRRAIVCDPESLEAALRGEAGTAVEIRKPGR